MEKMKLNYKNTIFVGFAFFLICAFWQAYDAIVPIMLVNKFGMNQAWSGVIMALDNILALFMLPLFGAISDKKKTRYGKRTPFIVIGTVAAVICFMSMTVLDYAQLKNNLGYTGIEIGSQAEKDMLWEYDPVLTLSSADENDDFITRLFASGEEVSLSEWVNDSERAEEEEAAYNVALEAYINGGSRNCPVQYDGMVRHRSYSEWREYYKALNEFIKTKDASVLGEGMGFVTVSDQDTFLGIPFKIPKSSVLLSDAYADMDAAQLDALEYSENDPIAKDMSLNEFYTEFVAEARSGYALNMTLKSPVCMIFFIILLLATLIAMASFRSPAVALMPDVTLKPLRSKGNAVINLMGTAGGMIVLGIGMLFKTSDASNALMSYIGYAAAVCGVMLAALALFIWKVRENALVSKMQQEAEKFGITEQTEKGEESDTHKLTKEQKISLGLILASVALWFIGYNAVTSKYSLYATNVLDKDYNLTLLIAQGAAIVSYLPVGMLATKFGRKKTIIAGVVMLAAAFTGGAFVTANTSGIVMYAFFALAGIAWATINVNSFPMVVELATGSNVGKYTGYYYTASMAAQIVTPIFSGLLMDQLGMGILFPYAAIASGLAVVTMIFVKHGDAARISAEDMPEDPVG